MLRPHRAVAISEQQGRLLAKRFAIGAALLSLFIYWLHPPILERLDVRVRDLAFQIRKPPPAPIEVVIVSIDEKSVKNHGRWPWPRATQAALIKQMKSMGAKVIALDIVYPTVQDESNDQALIAALQEPGAPVVGGYFFREEQTIPVAQQTIEQIRKSRVSTLLERPNARHDRISHFPYVEGNHPVIASHFDAYGFFNSSTDHDGLVRSAPLIQRYDDEYYPSLALKMLALGFERPLAIDINREGIEKIRLGEQVIPVNISGKLTLNFYNSERPIPLISASDILDGSIDSELLKGKLVFVGATELGIADIRPTPIDHNFPGVAIHATAAANIVQGFFLFHNSQTVLIDVALMTLLPFLMVWVMSKFERPLLMTLVFVTTAFIVWMIFFSAVTQYGLLISFFYPMLAIIIGYTIFEMYEIVVIQSRNRYIQRAFSSYVPPALVKRLIHEPGGLNLKGEKREITLLFSDIRGFTSISEKLPPEMLGMLLNDYLGAMTNILFKEKGTLDKYIGDAVMAIYNAPLDDPDHPILAVRTAIKMQSTLKELNKRYQQQFNVDMRIGIGIHTGKAIVGNFGSPRRFNYTAMGDAVNLASRLEGQTKYYGVEIIISEGTLKGLGGAFMVRKLDKIRVKGKLEPVEIFQLFSEGATPENTALAAKFDMAMESYYKGEFSSALNMLLDIEKSYSTDRPTQLMIERCQQFIEQPPEQWDGVHTATSK